MKLRKVLAGVLVSCAIFTTAANASPAAVNAEAANAKASIIDGNFASTADRQFLAAVGARVRRAAPKAPAAKPKAAAPAAPAKDTTKQYKPSESAKNYQEKAPSGNPSAAANNAVNSAATQQRSPLGNVMSRIGLFAGGMMLGSLLGNLFGMGTGWMPDIFGLLINVALFMALFAVGQMLWNKFKNRDKSER